MNHIPLRQILPGNERELPILSRYRTTLAQNVARRTNSSMRGSNADVTAPKLPDPYRIETEEKPV
jgi:hypothetical protein